MSKKVLVTGGAGFIGSHVVDQLVADGYTVRVIDDLSTGKLSNIERHVTSGKVDFKKGDIRDASFVKESLVEIDDVIHMAALVSVPLSVENPELAYDINLLGTINLLKLSAKIGIDRFVFISSCAVCGDPERLPVTEQTSLNPISPYAETKLLGERYCLGFDERELLRTVVLRFFNVYGPRQTMNDYSGVITRFIESCRQKRPLVIYGDGSQTRDFVHASDVAKGVGAALTKQVAGQVFNIGSGNPTSINLLAETILALTGADLQIHHENPREGDIRNSYADITKAQKLLNYEPKFSLRAGIQTLLECNTVCLPNGGL